MFKDIALIITVVLLFCDSCVQGTEIPSVRCCGIWKSMNHYIQSHSGIDRSICTETKCFQAGEIKLFESETNALLSHSMERKTAQDNSALFLIKNMSAVELEEMLVLSLIGRHFTSTRQNTIQDGKFFEFNVATRTMKLRKMECEFEKSIYVCMVVITIIILIFIITSRMVQEVIVKFNVNTEPDDEHSVYHENSSNEALGLRYRAIPIFK